MVSFMQIDPVLEKILWLRFIGEMRGMASTAFASDRLIFARCRGSKAEARASIVL
jgi:hypothetical protein